MNKLKVKVKFKEFLSKTVKVKANGHFDLDSANVTFLASLVSVQQLWNL